MFAKVLPSVDRTSRDVLIEPTQAALRPTCLVIGWLIMVTVKYNDRALVWIELVSKESLPPAADSKINARISPGALNVHY